jgi:hypothetical protein
VKARYREPAELSAIDPRAEGDCVRRVTCSQLSSGDALLFTARCEKLTETIARCFQSHDIYQ